MAIPLPQGIPFAPGTGTSPLHVAGRKDALRLIDQALDLIAVPLSQGGLRQSAMSPITIIGPRGVGKTTLLTCAAKMARERKMPVVRCPQLRGDDKPAVMRGFVDRMLGAYKTSHDISGELGMPSVAKAKYSTHIERRETYVKVLESMLLEKGVLLLLDEAMHYDTELLGMVLQEGQQLITDGMPLAMIIAGTPSLDGRLSQVDATFINRAQELRLNLLSTEEACEALENPLRQRGVKISDEAMKLLVSWTDCYPYFIQLAGAAAWNAKGEASEINLEVAEKAWEAMQEGREEYYCKIYDDIMRVNLLHHASKVVAMVEAAAEPLLPEQAIEQLEDASKDITFEDAHKIFNKLLDLGLMWFDRKAEIKAAIPSFFTYFRKRYRRWKPAGKDGH